MEKSTSTYRGIQIPHKQTLAKYGMSEQDYMDLIDEQNGVCPICRKAPSTGRMVVDHFHARYYSKMPPEKRKEYVRGLLCWFCNHSYLGRGITLAKAENMVEYLKAFEERRPLDNQKAKAKE